MKKVLLLSSLLALGAVASYGSDITATPCATGTLSTYMTQGFSCEVGDKIFSAFSYTANPNDPTAAQIDVGIDQNLGLEQFGLQFQSNVKGVVWNAIPFTLSYTITVDESQCIVLFSSNACAITAAQGAMQGALAPNTAAMSMTLSGAGTISLDAASTSDEVKQIRFGGITSTNVVIQGLTGVDGSDPIDSFGLDVYQTAIPEPMTFSLMGMGLLGLGLLRKRLS